MDTETVEGSPGVAAPKQRKKRPATLGDLKKKAQALRVAKAPPASGAQRRGRGRPAGELPGGRRGKPLVCRPSEQHVAALDRLVASERRPRATLLIMALEAYLAARGLWPAA